jgi:hypothetical protein
VLDEFGSPDAARVPRNYSRAGAPDAVEDPSPLSHRNDSTQQLASA